MPAIQFSETDRREMEVMKITEAQVLSQIETFERASFHLSIRRPCTPKDAVRRISSREGDEYLKLHEEAARKGRFTKFVPASGAATRMFQALLAHYHQPHPSQSSADRQAPPREFSLECRFERFFDQIRHFAFAEDLKNVMKQDGLDLDTTIKDGNLRDVLRYLFEDYGLGYGSCPKGLIGFHGYPSEYRTPFEEHLVEAAQYAFGGIGPCSLHFTVSPEHLERFQRLLERVQSAYEERYGRRFAVGFSVQKLSTNTIAVDLHNRPFRDLTGRLHFRPGGHGALLENLDELKGDLIYIKNIDNVVPDRLKGETVYWKKVLGGFLVETEAALHTHVRELKKGIDLHTIMPAAAFAIEKLSVHLPPDFHLWSVERQRELLLAKLDRPIRVCGMVPNEGEPGGAPFYTADAHGNLSIQIVESAQVDFTASGQRDLWESSTHFNPVDLVCSVRDEAGNPFNLRRQADPNTVFISKKSKDGKDLKALELPGLWNGAMADWITLLVEVPPITFNPVKTTCDLLRPTHQPESYVMDDRLCYRKR